MVDVKATKSGEIMITVRGQLRPRPSRSQKTTLLFDDSVVTTLNGRRCVLNLNLYTKDGWE